MNDASIDKWNRLAQLYLNEAITMPEIVKICLVISASGFIDDPDNQFAVGYNVLDNSQLNDALVFAVLLQRTEQTPITYQQVGDILGVTSRVAGAAIKRLLKDDAMEKDDYGNGGSIYHVKEDAKQLPVWLKEFTRALLELYYDAEKRKRTEEVMEKVDFKRGLQVLQQEVRDKFYKRGKKSQAD